MDPIERDLALREQIMAEKEAREEYKEIAMEEEKHRLLSTLEGMDEVLAYLLDRQDSPVKGYFLRMLVETVGKDSSESVQELNIRSTLNAVAYIMSEECADRMIKESE